MNAVAKTETKELTVAQPTPQAEGVLNSDILIPRLLLMQGLSDFVAGRKAQMGDMVRSTTVEKLGDIETPISFIPLKITTSWRENEKVGQKFEFRRSYPRGGKNEQLPWNFFMTPEGEELPAPSGRTTEWQRQKTIDVVALLPRDIEAFQKEMKKAEESGEMPDVSKTVLPINISFRSTSFNAGRAVSTFFAQVAEMAQYAKGLKHYHHVLPLSVKAEKNDKGNYYIFEVGKPAKASAELIEVADRWYQRLAAANVVVDEGAVDDTIPF